MNVYSGTEGDVLGFLLRLLHDFLNREVRLIGVFPMEHCGRDPDGISHFNVRCGQYVCHFVSPSQGTGHFAMAVFNMLNIHYY
jgi:hypothetical protein